MIDDLQAHKAKQKLKMQLKNANWKLQQCDSSENFEMMLYCYDHFDTEQMMLAGLRDSDIKRLTEMKQPMDIITSAVDATFVEYASAKNDKIQRKRAETLGMVSALYAINTSTYQKLKSTPLPEGKTKHFIVLLYRNKFTRECNLRPFSLMSETSILSIDDVKRASLPIIHRDQEVNPGFFNLSPVVSLK